MATPTQWGTDFLVNTTTANNQNQPSLTALSDGRFVAAWSDFSSSDFYDSVVRAQIFNADGGKSGAEFLVNAANAYDAREPATTALANGRFVVVWSEYGLKVSGGDTSSYAIRAQVFKADGSPASAKFLVNTSTFSFQIYPTITTLTDGRFVAAWDDGSRSGDYTSRFDVRAQVFNANGSKSGAEFLVNTSTINNQNQTALTALANGRFVAAWYDEGPDGDFGTTAAVRAQIFNADGSTSGGEFLINTNPVNTTPATAYQISPTLTALTDGRFVAAWSDDSLAVRAQTFNADGSKSGVEFLINTTTTDQQDPTLLALADGRFVAAWAGAGLANGDTSGGAVLAQVFNADGSKSGTEFLLNTTTANNQFAPTLAALADGRFVASWTDASQTGDDTSAAAVRAQIFDPRESAVVLPGSKFADDFVGTRWNDEMHGGRGQDSLKGHAGNDLLVGEVGNDTLDGGFGIDTLVGGRGNDTYYVDRENEQVVELAGEGVDTVISAWANLNLANFLNVENAQVTGVRNFTLTGNEGKNTLIGNSGVNLMEGLGGNDALFGKLGSDTLYGGNGNDSLEGANGIDSLFGGAGQDTLAGGLGRDHLSGGTGADVFVFHTKYEAGNFANRDVIADFTVVQDKIDLSAIDAQESLAGDQAFGFIGSTAFSGTAGELRYNAGNGRLMADTDGDAVADFQIQLIGKPAITAGDFLL